LKPSFVFSMMPSLSFATAVFLSPVRSTQKLCSAPRPTRPRSW
jgi:hypothetical protein